MKLEEKLVSLRKEKGLSQLQLAEIMNVSRQAVSRWEVGTSVPSTDNLRALGRLYNISLEYLLQDDMTVPTYLGAVDDNKIEKSYDKNRIQRLLLTAIFTIIGVLLIITIFFLRERDESVVSIENIEGSVVTTIDEEDFELTW